MTIGVGSRVPDLMAETYVPGIPQPTRMTLTSDEAVWTVLVFYPRDFTFICPTELQALARLEDDFQAAGARVVAAGTDSYWSHKAWFESAPALADARYPVIADTAHELSRAFGVLGADGVARRGTFVIDPEGVVRHASVGRKPAETLRTVQALQAADWRPLQLAA